MKKLKHYKQTRYKAHKKPINRGVIAVCAAVVLVFFASVALGLYLNTQISANDPEDTFDYGTDQSAPFDEYPKLPSSQAGVHPLGEGAYLSDEDADRALLRASGNMISALSVELLTADGTPRYASEVYARIYSAPSGSIDLRAFIEKAGKSSIDITAIMHLRSLTKEYADIADKRRSTEMALIEEAYGCGVRELLLVIPAEAAPELLYSYAKQIKQAAPELVLGAAIDAEALCSDYHLAAKLDDIFDYLAPNVTASFVKDMTASPDTNLPEDTSSSDTSEEDTQQSTANPAPPAESDLSAAILRSLVFCERFTSRIFIDVGDGCIECKDAALRELSAAGVKSFILGASSTHHPNEDTAPDTEN